MPWLPDFQSRAAGVAQGDARTSSLAARRSPGRSGPVRPADRTVAVGHNEQALSSVGGAEVGGPESGGLHRVTEIAQPAGNDVQTPPNESRDVLDNDESRAELRDDPQVLEPQAGSLAREPTAGGVGGADVLTGEPATDDIDG